MTRRFVLASDNKGKLREMRELLGDMGIELISRAEAGLTGEIEESGATFEENAYIKAKAAAEASALPAIADDSGFFVEALNGAPGVLSARYTGRHDDTDEARYMLVLKKMENEEHRGAGFVSCICCVFPNGDIIETRGECRGEVLRAPRGSGGFGYDPVFLPRGMEKSMAELTQGEKNEISHRAAALKKFKAKLREYYDKQ